jgi:hypothetical protein
LAAVVKLVSEKYAKRIEKLAIELYTAVCVHFFLAAVDWGLMGVHRLGTVLRRGELSLLIQSLSLD